MSLYEFPATLNNGKEKKLSSGWETLEGILWSPAGDEIWFTSASGSSATNPSAATLSGKVRTITTKGDTIEGTLKAKVRYPAHEKNAPSTKLFTTQVPTFWNGSLDRLEARLKQGKGSKKT